MLKEEAENVVTYYEERRKVVMNEIEHSSANIDSFSRGAVVMLHLLLAKDTKLLKQCYQTVAIMKNEACIPQSEVLEDDSDDAYSSDNYCSD